MATLQTLENIIRLKVPGANLQVIDSPNLWVFINKGVDDVNQRLKVMRKNTKFDVIASQQEYIISTILPDFLCMDDSGIWWNNGTLATPSFNQLLPKDRKWLDENVYSWRDYLAGTPIYYYQEDDTLGFVAPPAVAVSQGFWIYYIQAAVAMSNASHYPFVGTTTERPAYRCLDDGIIAYTQYQLQALLGNKSQGIMDEAAYMLELEKVESIFRRRPDINASRYYKMQGPISSVNGGR